jgi:hypothetical protein
MKTAVERGIGMAVALALLAPMSAAAAPPANLPGAASASGLVQVSTVPLVAGIRVVAKGHRYVTDARGTLTLPQAAIPGLRVEPTAIGPGVEARMSRWYRGRIALAYWYRINPRFFGPSGPVADRISEFRMHSSIGLRQVRRDLGGFWLQGTRIVPFSQGLRKKAISYAVDSVTVDGTNVVNRSQQHFVPSQSRRLDVRLLFNVAKFSARDAIFHFPVGSGVRLQYPNGRTREVRFGGKSIVVVPGLPRGQYHVKVIGGGWSPFRPVAVSRNQDVTLAVITYLDIGVVTFILLALCAGVFLYRRRYSHPDEPAEPRGGEAPAERPRRRGRRRVVAALAVAALLGAAAIVPAARASGPAPVFAYYYIWFNPSSWNRAKTDYPLLGRYSSDDSAVMRRHIGWAKAAGIDGFLVSWKHTEVLDRRLAKLVKLANRLHFRLGLVYEGLDFRRRPLHVAHVAADLDAFEKKYAHNPAFASFGKPVVVWTGTWRFSPAEIASVTRSRRTSLRILASQKTAADYERIASLVDGDAYYWSSVNPQTYTDFGQKLAEMGASVHRHGGLWIAPAAPGFDARLVGGTRAVPRRDGDTLRVEMAAAAAAQPDVIGLISWNEFSENSYVEPSRRYNGRYLEVLAAIRGNRVKLGTKVDSARPAAGGAGWQVAVLGLLAIVTGGMLLAVRKRERARPRRRLGP